MSDKLQDRADELFEAALETSGARDPREFYRGRLRELRGSNPSAYEQAVAYYENELISAIAEGDKDPLAAWQEYGARLAEWSSPGRPLEVDATGRSHPHTPPAEGGRMVLHMPDGNGRALVISLPAELSSAQRATYDLLVAGKQKLREDGAG